MKNLANISFYFLILFFEPPPSQNEVKFPIIKVDVMKYVDIIINIPIKKTKVFL